MTGSSVVGTVRAGGAADDDEPVETPDDEEAWRRVAEVGRIDGHAVGVCSTCGEWTSVAVEPLISRGPRKGQRRTPWPECRYCHGGQVVPSDEALEGVTPRRRPTIPRAPAVEDTRVRLPWPGVDE